MPLSLPEFLCQMAASPALTLTVLLTLAVLLVNGWTDAPNAIAAAVVTGALPFRPAVGLAALCILLNVLDWGTLKVIGEFQKKGPLLFAGQYLYYAFEVVLVLLIAAFGQRFWEALRKGRSRFPFGGVVLCCTWGAIHMLSRGSLSTGLGVMAFGLMYGAIYVLLGRDARTSYLAMLAAFVI